MTGRISPPLNENPTGAGAFTPAWGDFLEDVGRVAGLALTTDGKGATIVAVTVTVSPFAYAAAARGKLAITGGTVTGLTLRRGGTTINTGPLVLIPLAVGDVATVTYTALPTIQFLPD